MSAKSGFNIPSGDTWSCEGYQTPADSEQLRDSTSGRFITRQKLRTNTAARMEKMRSIKAGAVKRKLNYDSDTEEPPRKIPTRKTVGAVSSFSQKKYQLPSILHGFSQWALRT